MSGEEHSNEREAMNDDELRNIAERNPAASDDPRSGADEEIESSQASQMQADHKCETEQSDDTIAIINDENEHGDVFSAAYIKSGEEHHSDKTQEIKTGDTTEPSSPHALSAKAIPFFYPTANTSDTTSVSLAGSAKKPRHRAGAKRNQSKRRAAASGEDSTAESRTDDVVADTTAATRKKHHRGGSKWNYSNLSSPSVQNGPPKDFLTGSGGEGFGTDGSSSAVAQDSRKAHQDREGGDDPTRDDHNTEGHVGDDHAEHHHTGDDRTGDDQAVEGQTAHDQAGREARPLQNLENEDSSHSSKDTATLGQTPTAPSEESTGLINIALENAPTTAPCSQERSSRQDYQPDLLPWRPRRSSPLRNTHAAVTYRPHVLTDLEEEVDHAAVPVSTFSESSNGDDNGRASPSAAEPTTPIPRAASATGLYTSPTGSNWDDDEGDDPAYLRAAHRRMSEGNFSGTQLPPSSSPPPRPPARAGHRDGDIEDHETTPSATPQPAPSPTDVHPEKKAPLRWSANNGRPFLPGSPNLLQLRSDTVHPSGKSEVSLPISNASIIDSLTGEPLKVLSGHFKSKSRALVTAREDFIMSQRRQRGYPGVRLPQTVEDERDMGYRKATERRIKLEKMARGYQRLQQQNDRAQADLQDRLDKLQRDGLAMSDRIDWQKQLLEKKDNDNEQQLVTIEDHERYKAKLLEYCEEMRRTAELSQEQLSRVKQRDYKSANTQSSEFLGPNNTRRDGEALENHVEYLQLPPDVLKQLEHLVVEWLEGHDERREYRNPREEAGVDQSDRNDTDDSSQHAEPDQVGRSPQETSGRDDNHRSVRDIFAESVQNGFSYQNLVSALEQAGYEFRVDHLATQIETVLRDADIYSVDVLFMARQHESFNLHTVGHVIRDLVENLGQTVRAGVYTHFQRCYDEFQGAAAAQRAEVLALERKLRERESTIAQILHDADCSNEAFNQQIQELQETLAECQQHRSSCRNCILLTAKILGLETYVEALRAETLRHETVENDGDESEQESDHTPREANETVSVPAKECSQCPKRVYHITKLLMKLQGVQGENKELRQQLEDFEQENKGLRQQLQRYKREDMHATRDIFNVRPKKKPDTISSPTSTQQPSEDANQPASSSSPPTSWREYEGRFRSRESFQTTLRAVKEKRAKERREGRDLEDLRVEAYTSHFGWSNGIPDVDISQRVNRWTDMTRKRR